MQTVSLYYWAGAKAAAGVASESVSATTVGAALRMAVEARADARFSRVVEACSFLIDGIAAHPDDLERVLRGPVRVDVLPPFAGGAPPVSARQAEEVPRVRPLVRTNV